MSLELAPIETVAAMPLRTALASWHAEHGGRMVDFAGWWMPVQYSSIVEEHQATRRAIGLFDVSHMGRLDLAGSHTSDFLDQVLTRRTADMRPGQVRYSLVCGENGGILDDILVYRLPGPDAWQLVVNASNRVKLLAWFAEQIAVFGDVKLVDRTFESVMFAVQGPRVMDLLTPHASVDLGAMRYYTAQKATVWGIECLLARTGYTGEDGCELIASAADGERLWQTVIQHGESLGLKPAGLGCRDTLRLEAGMPLYGHELSEKINAATTGLTFAINLDGRDFVGSKAIRGELNRGPSYARVGLTLEGKRAAREGYAVLQNGERIGEITSGTFSPTFEKPIAMAYVRHEHATIGAPLEIDLRGKPAKAEVVPLPFYKRSK